MTRPTKLSVLLVVVLAITTACYPPSQTPTDQPIPPGGRVIATAPALTELSIEDATDDLSTILFRRNDFLIPPGDPIPYRYWVWDEAAGTTTEVPVGRAEFGLADLSTDGRQVVFASNDSRIQVGPTSVNCASYNGPWIPDTPTMCEEIYLFDRDTGERRQLTGLGGSSEFHNSSPTFSEDGTGIRFTRRTGTPFNPIFTSLHLDLATGDITDAVGPPAPPTSWDRGSHVVAWDRATATLTSTDKATGEVTTLWTDDLTPHFHLAAQIDDGRLIVLSRYESEYAQVPVFRLIDTDTRSIRTVLSQWISRDGSRFAAVQRNVAPDAIDRLVIAPLPS